VTVTATAENGIPGATAVSVHPRTIVLYDSFSDVNERGLSAHEAELNSLRSQSFGGYGEALIQNGQVVASESTRSQAN
jgi:hypothetical protein